MTTLQFHPDQSIRGNLLYAVLKPHLRDGQAILDIGCAYSCLAGLIHADFPKCQLFGFDSDGRIITELKKEHPHYAWKRVLIKNGDDLHGRLLFCPDVIIHIGVDAGWSNIWKVHPWLLENISPKLVFLEAGRNDGYEGCATVCNKIMLLYIEAGYEVLVSGQFGFDYDGECLRDRRWCVLQKQ